jgi:hypothetical protein
MDLSIKLFLYVAFSLLVILVGGYQLATSGRMIAAVLFVILIVAVLAVYGVRWFRGDGSVFNKPVGQWPPSINTCPDYLTYYQRTKSDGTKADTCIDRIGVSRNGQLKVFPSGGSTDDACFFPLATAASDPVKKVGELCQRTIQYGLTWEGVTDGESCFMPGGAVTPASTAPASGDNCLLRMPGSGSA